VEFFFPKAVDKHSETKGVIRDVSFSPSQTPFDVFFLLSFLL
jgi:hypothetical protein